MTNTDGHDTGPTLIMNGKEVTESENRILMILTMSKKSFRFLFRD